MRGFGTIFRQKGSRFLWMQYWHNGQRHRESTACEKPKAAQDILRKKLLELDRLGSNAIPLSVRRISVGDLYESLERDYVINARKSLRDLKTRWKKHLQNAFSEMSVTAVTTEHIGAYIAKRLQETAANATINRELAALKRMYKLAIKTGRLKYGEQPFIQTLKERNVRKGFVKDGEYTELACATGEIGLWLRALFEAGYTYGWRKEEFLSRRVRHADLLERTLGLDPGETKNGEARTVHMTARMFELIKQCCAGKNPEDYIFTRTKDQLSRRPRSVRIVDFRDAWTEACSSAGVIGLLFHDLRRTAVSNMIRDGVSEKQAMTISGHLTRNVFDRYHIVDPAQGREIARKMEKGAASRIREARQRELFTEQTPPPSKPPVGSKDSQRTVIVPEFRKAN